MTQRRFFFPLGMYFMLLSAAGIWDIRALLVSPQHQRAELHVLHLQAYLMQGSDVPYSLHLQKSRSSSPWLQHSCRMVPKVIPSLVVWMLQVVQQLSVTIFHHCHIGRTILYCKTPICYCQSGPQHTLKAKLVVSKFSITNLSKLTCLQNCKSQSTLNWIISFRPGLAWLSVHPCFFENWFLADDHGSYKTVFIKQFYIWKELSFAIISTTCLRKGLGFTTAWWEK